MSNSISIHAPPRGATAWWVVPPLRQKRFQFTPLREGRRMQVVTFQRQRERFQFTPLREGRRFVDAQKAADKVFQFTPLREGRPVGGFIFCTALLFQFTPLREGRPSMSMLVMRCIVISIHAPPRGATKTVTRLQSASFYFNSRPSARGDLRQNRYVLPRHISIHAPPRGATSRRKGILSR